MTQDRGHPLPRHATLAAGVRLKEAGLEAKKSWGQHFLADRSVLHDIVVASGVGQGDTVVELGAGLGALTEALLARRARVVAVERDRDLAPLLAPQLVPNAPPGAELVLLEADAARLDYAKLAGTYGGPLNVLGNLPYQISSRIMVNLADAGPSVARATLLVQREVADRLCAAPSSRTYGLLTVLVGRRFAAHVVRRVPPGAFVPPPKVDSTVVQLTAHAGPAIDPADDVALVAAARAAFGARRKILRGALARALHCSPAAAEAAIRAANLDPGCRAETLSLKDYLALGRALSAANLLPKTPHEAP